MRKIKTNLIFYRASAGKSTFWTQNDTNSAKYRYTENKKTVHVTCGTYSTALASRDKSRGDTIKLGSPSAVPSCRLIRNFLRGGQKMDFFVPHRAIKSTLWPASRKYNVQLRKKVYFGCVKFDSRAKRGQQ